jgi:hypothetical protein
MAKHASIRSIQPRNCALQLIVDLNLPGYGSGYGIWFELDQPVLHKTDLTFIKYLPQLTPMHAYQWRKDIEFYRLQAAPCLLRQSYLDRLSSKASWTSQVGTEALTLQTAESEESNALGGKGIRSSVTVANQTSAIAGVGSIPVRNNRGPGRRIRPPWHMLGSRVARYSRQSRCAVCKPG